MDKKRVLIIDESQKSIDRLTLLLEKLTDYEVDVLDECETALNYFKKYVYEYVIIDHNCKNANEFVEYVLTNKAKQKVILLSDSIDCPIDCDSCLKTFRFVRLLKPIGVKDIINYIGDDKEFICPNKHRFDSIDTLEKLYDFIYLDENYFFTIKEIKEDKLIIRSNLSGTIRFKELLKIENLINPKYFTLKINPDNTLEIKVN